VTSSRFHLGFIQVFAATAVVQGLAACAQGVASDPPPGTSPEVARQNPSLVDAAPAPGDAGASSDAAVSDAPSDSPVVGDAPEVGPPDTGLVDAGPPPTVDGVIGAGEYGVHVDGQNQQTSSSVWYMTWNNTNLYIGITAANVLEGMVLYIDVAPLMPSNSGTNADGSLVGEAYDGTGVKLPFRADFVAYVKQGYQEVRVANGAGGWSAPVAGAVTLTGAGTTRELSIAWTAIRAGGRPASFSWLGYVTSAAGFAYGQLPVDNPAGPIGPMANLPFFYKVSDSTPGVGTKPFAVKLSP